MESFGDNTTMESTTRQFSDLNLSTAESNKPSPLPHICPRILKRIPKSISKSTIKADKSYIAVLEDGRPRRDRKRNEGRRTKWWRTREKALMHHPRGFVQDSGLAAKMESYYKILEEAYEDGCEDGSLPPHATDTAGMDGEKSQDSFALHTKHLDKECELRGTAAWQHFDEKLARDRVATTLSLHFASSLDLAREVAQHATRDDGSGPSSKHRSPILFLRQGGLP